MLDKVHHELPVSLLQWTDQFLDHRGVIRGKVASTPYEPLNWAAKEFTQVHQACERRQHHSSLDPRNCLSSNTQSLGNLILCQARTDAFLSDGHPYRARQ